MNNPVTDALIEPPDDPVEELNLRMAVASTDIAELRAEICRLDRDLDESRRLNLRAAELLDLVYEQLTGVAQGTAAPGAAVPDTSTPGKAS